MLIPLRSGLCSTGLTTTTPLAFRLAEALPPFLMSDSSLFSLLAFVGVFASPADASSKEAAYVTTACKVAPAASISATLPSEPVVIAPARDSSGLPGAAAPPAAPLTVPLALQLASPRSAIIRAIAASVRAPRLNSARTLAQAFRPSTVATRLASFFFFSSISSFSSFSFSFSFLARSARSCRCLSNFLSPLHAPMPPAKRVSSASFELFPIVACAPRQLFARKNSIISLAKPTL
mmetsp:Transcript_32396/g.88769  ORF Transcript_32396/g.88769 Transcript_32396/m.88769 type:complete len:235 (-) Transcript_32396:163-867(-)